MKDRDQNQRLLYAQGWEDPAVLRGALRLGPNDDVLSIAAAGDNTFALLLDDPRSVTAFDRSPAQLHLVQLKMAALRGLPREDTLELLGEAPSDRRDELFRAIRDRLPATSRAFWESPAPQRWLREGVVGAGKFERYLSAFRRFVVPLIHSRATIERLLGLDDREEQERFYRESWDTWRWRALFRLFFSRHVMERAGRERAFFDHVDADSLGDIFRERVRWAFTAISVRDNPYVQWILTGERRATRLLPPYLQPDNYERVAARLDRVRLVEGELIDQLRKAPDGTYSAFNLSDLFEYLSEEECAERYEELVRAARGGARVCYWNLLVPRERPAALAGRVDQELDLAARLSGEDRAFFYGRLVIERVA